MSESLTADVIIVGSGVAGAMSAWSLAKRGVKVIVLEAGPRLSREEIVTAYRNTPHQDLSSGYPNPSWAPRPDWAAGADQYIEQAGPVVTKVEYLRMVGGTTWHWGGNALRPQPVELQMRSRYGVGQDWSVSYADLEPYFCQAEKEMGVAGNNAMDTGSPRSQQYPLPPIPPSYSDQTIANALRAMGVEFISRTVARNSRAYDNRPQCQGSGTCSPICPVGAQYAAIVHVEKAEQLGARVIENARVDRLDTDENQQIKTLHFTRADGSSGTASGRVVVLAANGIENPRLLLMSVNDRYPNGLANHSGVVGRYYMDHPAMYARITLPQPVYSPRGPEININSFTHRDGDFRREHSSWILVAFNRLRIYDFANHAIKNNLLPPALDEVIRHRAMHQIELDAHLEQLPQRENGISLDWSQRDNAGQPRIRLYFSYGDYEKKAFEKVKSFFWSASQTLQATETSISEPYTHHHLMGMTRMGTDPKDSVVDNECRSHDHTNLFILGSSVFPTGTTASPTLTIAALSLRAADSIHQQLQGGK